MYIRAGCSEFKLSTSEVQSGYHETCRQVARHTAAHAPAKSLLRDHAEPLCLSGQAVDQLPAGESGWSGEGGVRASSGSSGTVSNMPQK